MDVNGVIGQEVEKEKLEKSLNLAIKFKVGRLWIQKSFSDEVTFG